LFENRHSYPQTIPHGEALAQLVLIPRYTNASPSYAARRRSEISPTEELALPLQHLTFPAAEVVED